MVEFLGFWLSRIAAALLDCRLLRRDDGGLGVALALSAIVVAGCLIAMALYT